MSSSLSPLTSKTLDVATRGGDLIRFLGPVTIPDQPILVEGKNDTDWIVLDARIDPHFQNNQLGMPPRCVRHLRKIAAQQIDFDGILVGHELPAGTIARLRKDGGDAVKLDPALLAKEIGQPPVDVAARKMSRVADATARTILTIAKVVGLAAAGIAAAPVAALAALDLDPVLFGVVTDDPEVRSGSLAGLFYITHWNN